MPSREISPGIRVNTYLDKILAKPVKLAIGLMSGTSLDGMDAALLEIEGAGCSTKARFIDSLTLPYDGDVREALMKAAMGDEGGSRLVCGLNFLVGEIAADAALALCGKSGIDHRTIDFAGSHGQTVCHLNDPAPIGGRLARGTLQIGEASVIAERLGCPVVSDFRVRDMAAGGQGAPLVPYTEYLLYRREDKAIALLNIGGIANVTLLPAGCGVGGITAFDTGPGNMAIDAAAQALLGTPRDDDGNAAAGGRHNEGLLEWMRSLDRDYLKKPPPKSTGRERYNAGYIGMLLAHSREMGLGSSETLATITRYTAETIALGIRRFCSPPPEELYVSGGGLHNKTLMSFIRELLPGCTVRGGGDLGIPPDAKEAAAFALLANEAIHGLCNNAPSATGASHPVVMGKLSV